MNAQVFAAAVFCCAISQVNLMPAQDYAKKHQSYLELGPLFLEMQEFLKPDTSRILKPSEVLALKPKLIKNAEKLMMYHLIDGKGFSHLLTDHSLQRLLDFNVIAIVSPVESKIMKDPGFGHRMVILEKNGKLKSFAYNLTLKEAIYNLPQNYPFNFSTSENHYHTAFQNIKPVALNFESSTKKAVIQKSLQAPVKSNVENFIDEESIEKLPEDLKITAVSLPKFGIINTISDEILSSVPSNE